jgi:tRNA threonylcarbamoyladenosine biosynthesis protein TsaE
MKEIRGLEKMYEEAQQFAEALEPFSDKATVIALKGDLGAGKTVFTRGVARAFGVEESVTSPTFVIEKIYALSRGPFKRLIHIDAYRLQSAHELEVLGWDEIQHEPTNLILLEWPELVGAAIPEGIPLVTFTFIDENTRSLTYGTTSAA